MSNKTVLITGAAGFIGAFLGKRLLERGDVRVVGVDNLNDYYDVGIKEDRLRMLAEAAGGSADDADLAGFSCGGFSFVKMDIADADAVERIIRSSISSTPRHRAFMAPMPRFPTPRKT